MGHGGRVGIGVAVAALFVAFAGCTPGGDAGAGPTAERTAPSETVSTTPSPTPTAAAGPSLAFDGDCANVLADPAVYIGAPTEYPPQHWPSPVATLGGLSCSWFTGAGDGAWITALPADTVGDDVQSRFAEPVCDSAYDAIECRQGAVAAGTWVLVGMPQGQQQPDLRPILDEALANAAAFADPVAPERSDRWWGAVDCAALESEIDVAGMFGGATFEAGYPTGFARDPLAEVVEPEGVSFWCPWYSYDAQQGLRINVFPGAGFQFAEIEGTPASVAGAADAALTEQFSTSVLVATDGVNIVTVQESPTSLEDAAARVLSALD